MNNPRDPNPSPCLEGRVKQVQGLHTALEEVSSLYAWDRPALHSPVKGEGAREPGLANSVIVVTRLPADLQQLAAFMGLTGNYTRSRFIKHKKHHQLNVAYNDIDILFPFAGGHHRHRAITCPPT